MRAVIVLAVFVGLPILEIWVILQVGHQIGVLPTVLLLVAESALGAWVVKREGVRAWRALTQALTSGVPPARELADAALVLVGGVLLLTPGFVTDVFGFFFVLPFTRPLARRLLTVVLAQRVVGRSGGPAPRGRGGVHRTYPKDPEA